MVTAESGGDDNGLILKVLDQSIPVWCQIGTVRAEIVGDDTGTV